MTETITQAKAEDAIASTNAFLATERGASLDGDFASGQIAERVASVGERAVDLLHAVPHPKLRGLYVPLSQHNAGSYSEAVAVLPGYLVLVPSALIEVGPSVFYPAVVSEDGLKSGVLRLHVLRQEYHRQLGYGAAMVLSAAGQAETKGIGEHGRKPTDGIEAEHFATLLAAGSDQKLQHAWQSGQHSNHAWREQQTNSVTAEVSKRLFGSAMPQTTITVTRQQIETGRAMLFWHEGMYAAQTAQPETATRANALVVMQGLGYQALQRTNPRGLEAVKRLMAA